MEAMGSDFRGPPIHKQDTLDCNQSMYRPTPRTLTIDTTTTTTTTTFTTVLLLLQLQLNICDISLIIY